MRSHWWPGPCCLHQSRVLSAPRRKIWGFLVCKNSNSGTCSHYCRQTQCRNPCCVFLEAMKLGPHLSNVFLLSDLVYENFYNKFLRLDVCNFLRVTSVSPHPIDVWLFPECALFFWAVQVDFIIVFIESFRHVVRRRIPGTGFVNFFFHEWRLEVADLGQLLRRWAFEVSRFWSFVVTESARSNFAVRTIINVTDQRGFGFSLCGNWPAHSWWWAARFYFSDHHALAWSLFVVCNPWRTAEKSPVVQDVLWLLGTFVWGQVDLKFRGFVVW